MKALCSIGAGAHAALLEVSRPTFAAYAQRHGYELITSTEGDPSRPPAWGKVALLREVLATHGLALWIDADAVIVDPSQDIADELEPDRELALVRHRHRGQLIPNTGVVLLRAGAFADELLERVWNAERFLHHPWWEQAALIDALGYDLPGVLDAGLRGRLHRFAARRLGRELRPCRPVRPSPYLARTQFLGAEWNSVPHDRAIRPRIVHFPAVPNEERRRHMAAELEG